MIKIFPATAKKFNTNGLKVIFPISCVEYKKKSLNGWYIEAEIDIKYKKYIVKDNIIAVKTKSKIIPQGFRIEKIEERTSTIFVIANHVMFDAENYYLDDVRPTNLSASNALNYINERTDIKSPFSFSSNITKTSTQYIVDKNLLEAMSLIEERWGGFFDADNFEISFKSKLGRNNGEIIRQKKNLVSRVITEDWSNVVTKLYPKGPDDLILPEKFLESEIKYSVPYTKHEKFDFDIAELTEEEKIDKLREISVRHLEENKYPQVCYELDANIQNVEIGDQVQVIDNSIDIMTEIQEYVYDLNTKKIKNLVFGNYVKNVREKFSNIKTTILDVINTVSKQQIMIQNQTDLINSLNKNGIIKITDNEILILDKLPIEDAKNVWRFGLGGLAFSKNGYEGPFETAITIDGKINANFIMSGKMSTERIEGFEQILLTVSNIQNFKEEKTGKNQLIINNAQEGTLLGLSIAGEIELLFPSEDLYPSDDLYPLDSYLNIENSVGEIRQVLLPITHLYKIEDVSDEFVLERSYNEEIKKYESKCKIIRRITVDSSGNKNVLQAEFIEDLGLLDIQLWKGTNKIYLESFPGLNYSCKYTIINEITDSFATHLELNSAIEQTESSITESVNALIDGLDIELNAKLELKVDLKELVSSLNASADEIYFEGNRIRIKSQYFELTKDGKITATSGIIAGWNITTNQLWCEIKPPYDYSEADVNRIQQIALGNIVPTDNDYERLDFNKDGIINSYDLLLCRKMTYYNIGVSHPGRLIFDTSDWFNPIKIINGNGERVASFGFHGVSTKDLD